MVLTHSECPAKSEPLLLKNVAMVKTVVTDILGVAPVLLHKSQKRFSL